jgi:3-isopropylmalate/(R)-2-methylmalate dehydratase small subunit
MTLHTGTVIKVGDDIDTDIIIPSEYMTFKTIGEMVRYAFHPLRPDIPDKVRPGDVLVAGKNFGCGSSREQASEIIKALGVYCVIARSFSRLFYRNAITNGLLVLQSEEAPDLFEEGDEIAVDMARQRIITAGSQEVGFDRLPERLIEMVRTGGLIEYWRRRNRA